MANRPVFRTNTFQPHYKEIPIDFRYFPGFAESQAKKSIQSLHEAYLERFPKANVLEISTKSDNLLGQRLSAFNLKMDINGIWYSVENVFQAGKVFQFGGPYSDLMEILPFSIKKDERLHNSGELKGFVFRDQSFSLEPKTFFYDWIYINALYQNADLVQDIIKYDSFTDIAFNPEKSINCQARTAAIFVSLYNSNLLNEALYSAETFKEIVYGTYLDTVFEQESLF